MSAKCQKRTLVETESSDRECELSAALADARIRRLDAVNVPRELGPHVIDQCITSPQGDMKAIVRSGPGGVKD